uniref:Ornithine decarboxylase n=1 Tax=Strombidium rassoulzadegani TaxID=1082188 RepID=A0A7S3CHU0_9SPIT|mmetsp:Transcript_1003/g.1804  ORF Transcript_1003/g.1804 Transcript_1003/m.1804 type:complete len:186 (+) Transcript_1003:766-1323(+)
MNSRKIFDRAVELGMPEMTFLDVGGGFTLVHEQKVKNFDFVAPKLNNMLEKYFPDPKVRVIGEPGRFVSESVVYMASPIIGQKVMKSGARHYYLNNGIYQGYSVRIFGEEQFISPLDRKIEKREKAKTTWWGQTCDSCDWIIKDKMHPVYKTGEWVFTWDHGAYHKDLTNNFNGFPLGDTHYKFD